MIEGAAIFLVGLLIGFILRRRKPEIIQVTTATCACKHVRSMHVEGKGKCTETEVESYHEYDNKAGATVRKHREYKCSCQLYDGPEPLPEYFAKELE